MRVNVKGWERLIIVIFTLKGKTFRFFFKNYLIVNKAYMLNMLKNDECDSTANIWKCASLKTLKYFMFLLDLRGCIKKYMGVWV